MLLGDNPRYINTSIRNIELQILH